MSSKFIESLFDSTMRGCEKQLDLTWRRNEAITSNIANAETPQYKATDLSFATELERAFGQSQDQLTGVSKSNSKHLDTTSDAGAHFIPDLSGATKGDGNNVDIDIQMGKLALNSNEFSMAGNMIRKKFYFIKTAIREAGR
jgi:flagellar basal-body rod protein FlgB